MSVAVYRVTDKKCATCRWWQGMRGVEMRANRPYYVKADSASARCVACGDAVTAGNRCLKWQKWVSI